MADEDTIVKRNRRNVVLTGLPRSGTTLACHLLNKLPNTVALLEPLEPEQFVERLPDRDAVARDLERWYRRMRKMAIRRGEVVSKHVDGEIPDNPFEERRPGREPRQWLARKGKIQVSKDLERAFFLVVKDPPMFTALLPTLARRFPTFAVVRNPLAVLASWQSVDIPARQGRIPKAELYDPRLVQRLTAIDDRLERQLVLLDWWCERFERYLPSDHIIRYEDITLSGGRALATIVPAAKELNERLVGRNANSLYDRNGVAQIGERLLESEGAYWRFYPRESVAELLARFT